MTMRRVWKRRGILVQLIGLSLAAVGCDDAGPLVIDTSDPLACKQSYEFGNFGCARIQLALAVPDPLWQPPLMWRYQVRPLPLNDGQFASYGEIQGDTTVTITWFMPPHMHGNVRPDTASAWVAVRVYQDIYPYELFAIDSTLAVLRFSDVGVIPVVDTVRLDLRGGG